MHAAAPCHDYSNGCIASALSPHLVRLAHSVCSQLIHISNVLLPKHLLSRSIRCLDNATCSQQTTSETRQNATQGSSNTKDSCHEQIVRSDENALVIANAPLYAGESNCLLDTTQKHRRCDTPPIHQQSPGVRSDVLQDMRKSRSLLADSILCMQQLLAMITAMAVLPQHYCLSTIVHQALDNDTCSQQTASEMRQTCKVGR